MKFKRNFKFMKKIFITLAALAVAAMAMATTSMAAYDYTTGATEVGIDATAASAVTALEDQQLTVIIVAADPTTKLLPTTISDSDILYIDQGAKGEISFEAMKVISALPDGDYVIGIGGEDIAEGIIIDQFTVGTDEEPEEEIMYGNVNFDYKRDGVTLADPQSINGKDVSALELYVAGLYTEEDINYAAANVNIDYKRDGVTLADPQSINGKDVLALEYFISEIPGYETLPYDANKQ